MMTVRQAEGFLLDVVRQHHDLMDPDLITGSDVYLDPVSMEWQIGKKVRKGNVVLAWSKCAVYEVLPENIEVIRQAANSFGWSYSDMKKDDEGSWLEVYAGALSIMWVLRAEAQPDSHATPPMVDGDSLGLT